MTDASLFTEKGNSGSEDVSGGTEDTNKAVATGEKPTYTEQFKGELKNSDAFNDLPSLDDLGNAYITMKGSLDGAVIKPGENATDEERATYDKAVAEMRGIPESPDAYDLKIPEGMEVNEEVLKATKETYHKRGYTNEQAQALVDDAAEAFKGQKEATEKYEAELTEKEGKVLAETYGDSLKEVRALAERSALQFGGEDFKTFLKDSGMENSPPMVRLLSNIAKVVSEDRIGTEQEPVKEKERKRTEAGTPMLKFTSME